MLKLVQPPAKVYEPKPQDAYLEKVYCPNCDAKRTKPCECRRNKLPLAYNLKGDLP